MIIKRSKDFLIEKLIHFTINKNDSEREIASNKAEAHKDLTTATELMCKVHYVSSSDIYLVVCGL